MSHLSFSHAKDMNRILLVITLALSYLFLGQSTELSAQTPDTIYVNARVVTVDARFSVQQAFAVAGERFVAVGTAREIRALAGPQTRVVDLKGRTVIPGLMDNHSHQYHAGLVMERGVPLEGVKSIAEMQQRLREAAKSAAPGSVIYGQMGWEPGELAEKRPQTFAGAAPGLDNARTYLQYLYGLFFQDDWKARPNLTLNLGVRFDPSDGPHERFKRESTVDNWITATAFQTNIGLYNNPSKRYWSPRVGFAWDPHGNGMTAVRGGFGLFYMQLLSEIGRAHV